MSAFELYLLIKLDAIRAFILSVGGIGLTAVSIFSVAVFLCVADEMCMDDDDIAKKRWMWTKAPKIGIPASLLVMLLGVLLPTTKEAAVIWAVPKVLESRIAKQDIPELYDLAVEWAKEKLDE